VSPTLPVPRAGAYARLVLVPLLALAWILPWADASEPVRGLVVTQVGATRTGLPGLAALALLWGWSLTAVCARTRAGAQAGEAFSAAGLAAGVSVLLLLEQGWLPTAERGRALLPVFVPLALLAAIDGLLRWTSARRGVAPDGSVSAVRVATGVFTAGALVADDAYGPAGLAFAIAAGPLAFLVGTSGSAARRSLDLLLTLGALAAGFAPTLWRLLERVPEPIDGLLPAAVAWSVLAALVVLTSASGLLAPADEMGAPPPAPAAPSGPAAWA
jgi:hypothetical protein